MGDKTYEGLMNSAEYGNYADIEFYYTDSSGNEQTKLIISNIGTLIPTGSAYDEDGEDRNIS